MQKESFQNSENHSDCEDNDRTKTGFTPVKNPLSNNLRFLFHSPGTRVVEELESLQQRCIYLLNPKILEGSPVTENIRARLMCFLMQECSKQVIFRETYALACKYLDLYFLNGGQIELEDYQDLVISCLVIACKMLEGRGPLVSSEVFSLPKLRELQEKVLVRLNYFLNPVTYFSYAQRMILLWDSFVDAKKKYNFNFSKEKAGVNYKLRAFYQQLDFVFMALRTLQWKIEHVVINLFYLHARRLNVYENEAAGKSAEEFRRVFYPKDDLFLAFFQGQFLPYYSTQARVVLDPSMGEYLRAVIDLKPEKQNWIFDREDLFFQNIRQWDQIQTFPKDSYPIAKKIIKDLARKQEKT